MKTHHTNNQLKEISKIAARLSEEGIVVLAILAGFTYLRYLHSSDVWTFLIFFVALAGYLLVRFFKVREPN